MEKHKIVIIGAGPAGLKAAQVLAENGQDDILVLEKTGGKKLGSKVCSGMLYAANMAIFQIPPEIADTTLNIIRIYTPSAIYEIKFPYPFCYIIDRRNGKFGRWLIEKTRNKGIEIREFSEAKKLDKNNGEVMLKDGEIIGYDKLIIANGSDGEFRQQLGLKIRKNVLCTNIEVPYSDLEDKRKNAGHLYLNFGLNGVGYSGYTPKGDKVDFCQVFCNNKFLTKNNRISNFYRYVQEVEGVDLSNYEFLAKTVNYEPQKMRQSENIWIIGDGAGFGDIAGGLIASCAKSGEIAAYEILGEDISKELQEYFSWYKVGDVVTELIERINSRFLAKYLQESLIHFVMKNKFLWNTLVPMVLKLISPLPEDKWGGFDKDYYSKERFGFDLVDIEKLA